MQRIPKDAWGSVPWRTTISAAMDDSTTSAWSPEKVIAEELGKLTLHERGKAYEDVHGISIPVVETPELVEEYLRGMELELSRIPNKPAFDLAILLSEPFVMDRKFRLGFLRAQAFDVRLAASRMARYFETKLELFGQEKLVKTIMLEDLDIETQKAVARGSLSILPTKDTLGRPVLVSLPAFHLIEHMTISIMPKVVWYMISSIAEDEESQKKGLVCVMYTHDSKLKSSKTNCKVWWASGLSTGSLPIRVSSFHHCYESSIGPMMKIFSVIGSSYTRSRMRQHQGSHSECQYKLMTFGIPVKEFPITTQGQLKTGKHKGWVERRKQKETYLKTNAVQAGAVDLPIKCDVLLGKGMPCQEHAGNKHLHERVAMCYEEYDNAKRDRKTEIAEELVALVNKSSGRFLKRHEASGMWVEVPLREAREKVCHGFRRKREWDLKKGKSKPATMAVRVGEDDAGGRKKLKWAM